MVALPQVLVAAAGGDPDGASHGGTATASRHADTRGPAVTTAHVQAWIDFLATVEVRGPISITFAILQSADGAWILRSTMLVPDRAGSLACAGCGRPSADLPIIIQGALPGPDDTTPREQVIRQRVLGHYQHEALESIFVGGARAFDPHEARWYSNLVADWRFNR